MFLILILIQILILRFCVSFCALYIPFHFLFKGRKCNYALNCSHLYHNASKFNNERKKKLLQRHLFFRKQKKVELIKRLSIVFILHLLDMYIVCIWRIVVRVGEFSSLGYKIGKKCPKLNIPKDNLIGVMGRCQKVPKFDFQSQFSMSKIIGIFFNFLFHWRISF